MWVGTYPLRRGEIETSSFAVQPPRSKLSLSVTALPQESSKVLGFALPNILHSDSLCDGKGSHHMHVMVTGGTGYWESYGRRVARCWTQSPHNRQPFQL